MTTPAYRFIDRRGQSYGSGAPVYQTSTQNAERESYSDVLHDTRKNVSDCHRRALAILGRKLFADYPALESTILEQANLAVGTFLPLHYGGDRDWRKLALSWLVDEWLPICDLRGAPYDGETYLELHVISELRDGDMGTLLTETSQGYPAIQIIPGHRIRSPLGCSFVRVRMYQDQMWIGGILADQKRPYIQEDPIEWDALLCDGVIFGPYGNPLAYRVYDDDYGYGNYVDVSARNLFLNFHPKWTDQSRGLPALASSGWDWQDVKESRRFALIGQKLADALYAVETTETGQPNSATKFVQDAVYGTNNEVVETAVVNVKGGVKLFRAGSGSKIEFPAPNRPSMQAQQFQADVIRDALSGMEWSYIFGVDPSKAGGASLRVVVERINRVLEKRRKSPAKSFKRIIGFAIAKAMDLGLLPWNDEWWKWSFQGPGDITADKKYDSEVDISEIESGLSTNEIACARRGEYWEDVDEQKETETDSRIERAQRVAKKRGITWQEAYAFMWPPRTNAPKPAAAADNGNSEPNQQQDPNQDSGDPQQQDNQNG